MYIKINTLLSLNEWKKQKLVVKMRGNRLGAGDGSESDTGTSTGYKVKSETKGPYYIKPAIPLGCAHFDTNAPH